MASVLLEDRNVGDLLTADHTFLNERLARHYGITSVLGPQFRRVTLDDPRRWGLLGKGAVLLRTSYGDRTSPVLRGAWVLDKLMGTPPTPPPPDVETDLSHAQGRSAEDAARAAREPPREAGLQPVPRRDRSDRPGAGELRRHRPVARRATWKRKAPIDAKTVLPNGTPVDGPAELREALFGGRDLFVRALTEKLMMYALGRELEYYDMPQVRAVVRARRGAGLPVLGDRLRHRDERCVPHAGGRLRRATAPKAAPPKPRSQRRTDYVPDEEDISPAGPC